MKRLSSMDELPEQLKMRIEENNFILEDGKYPYYVTLHALDQESFQAYAKQIGVDAEDFAQQDTPIAIVIDQISYEDDASEEKLLKQNRLSQKLEIRIDLLTSAYWGYGE